MTPLVLVVFALAVFRATRLVTEDSITEPIRRRLDRRPRLVAFLECPWCVSMWLAGAAVVELEKRWVWWIFYPAALVLAFSAVAGSLAEHS